MKVSAVVISHGHADELEHSLPALAPQVDELLVIANIPGSVPAELPDGDARARERPRRSRSPRTRTSAPTNTEHELVLIANPDAVPGAGRGRDPARRSWRSIRAPASPGRRCSTATARWQASRRSFPTIGATLVRRTPLRLLFPPLALAAQATTCSTSGPTSRCRRTRCSARSCCCAATMLDEIGGWDAGYRMYCEDIDLNYRAAKAGWERWYVPAAVVHHEYAAVIDKRFLTRHTLWHARAMLRFLRKHPERLLALR